MSESKDNNSGIYEREQREDIGSRSGFSSKRGSFFVGSIGGGGGDENDQVPVIVIGPDNKEITTTDIVVAPDGGWGWVIVFAAFMSNLIVDGTILSFGVMQEDIIKSSSPNEDERESVSTVSWVGSLLFGFTLLSGPFTSALSNKFGFRIVAMSGSVLASLAFFLSYAFINHSTGKANMGVMFAIYGMIGGIGCSMIYVPAVIAVGFYFDKKRALATGIAICGSGCGTFIFAPLFSFLIKKLRWDRALLIQASLLFSCIVLGALYKPLKPPSQKNKGRGSSESNEKIMMTTSRQSVLGSSTHTPLLMRIKRARDSEMEKWDSVLSINSSTKRKFSGNSLGSEKLGLPTDIPRSNSVKGRIPPNLTEIVEESETNNKDDVRSYRIPISESRKKSKASISLMMSNSAAVSNADLSRSRIFKISSKTALNKPLNRDDIFYTGSLHRVPEYSDRKSNITAIFTSVSLKDENEDGKKGKKKFDFGVLTKLLDFSILKSPMFISLSISGFFTLLGYSVPFIYLKGLAETKGISINKATLLISVIGITNTLGRIISGAVADLPKVNTLWINNVALTTGGIATCFVPYFGTVAGYAGFVIYACIFGICIACFASLRSILVVELMGLSKLTSAFGIILLFQGVAAMCASPLAGALYDVTGSYDVSFYLAGALMIMSGILCYPLRIIKKWEMSKNIDVY